MKKIILIFILLAVLALGVFSLSSCSDAPEKIVLNVYNWGEYISDGSEESLDVNKTYGVQLTVNYTTYASNEDLYAKLKSGATGYDVIIPSDYMVQRMANEGMLEELNFDNIPNYRYIADYCKGLSYDPEEKYSVPYTWGTVGILYNKTMVKVFEDTVLLNFPLTCPCCRRETIINVVKLKLVSSEPTI